jgi:PAS domain S-box-containing protein
MLSKTKDLVLTLVTFSPRLTGWITFLAVLSVTMSLTSIGYRLKLSEERELVNIRLREFENLFSNTLNNGISAAKTLGFFAQNKQETVENFEEIGRQILDSNPQVDVIQLLDSGVIVAVYPLMGNESVIGYDVLKDSLNRPEVLESIKRKEVYFSGPLKLRQGGIAIAGRYPLFDKDKFVGLSAVIIYFDKLVLNALQAIPDKDRYQVQLTKINPITGAIQEFVSAEDSAAYTGYKASVPIEVGNWTLSVQLRQSKALHDLRWLIVGRIAISILLGFAAWNFARQPSLLIKKLNEKSEEILLANERFALASKATSDIIWDWDLITDEKYRSSQFAALFGYDEKEVQENKNFRIGLIHPEDLEYVLSNLEKTLASDARFWEIEFRGRKADQTYAYVREKGFIIRNTKGKAVRMIGATQNITQQKMDELKLIQANQKLSDANEELRVFASLASHDLREPLRMISSFMSLLQRKYGPSLDDKANLYISHAVDGAKRLTVMIADLLEYSKIGFESSAAECIDTKALVEEVLQLQSTLIIDSGATVRVGELPKVNAVKTPLQVLFQNLIGNALKYRIPDIPPVIEIDGRSFEDFWEFSVKDNGIGIDTEYLDEIFGILKRLHQKEKYSGTGIGLAICRKIVTQHGGKIWAESSPGLGSKFVFTIRKNEEKTY